MGMTDVVVRFIEPVMKTGRINLTPTKYKYKNTRIGKNIIITNLISDAIRNTRHNPLKIFFSFLGNNHKIEHSLQIL